MMNWSNNQVKSEIVEIIKVYSFWSFLTLEMAGQFECIALWDTVFSILFIIKNILTKVVGILHTAYCVQCKYSINSKGEFRLIWKHFPSQPEFTLNASMLFRTQPVPPNIVTWLAKGNAIYLFNFEYYWAAVFDIPFSSIPTCTQTWQAPYALNLSVMGLNLNLAYWFSVARLARHVQKWWGFF